MIVRMLIRRTRVVVTAAVVAFVIELALCAAARAQSTHVVVVDDPRPYLEAGIPAKGAPLHFTWSSAVSTPTAGTAIAAVAVQGFTNGLMYGYRLNGVLRVADSTGRLDIGDLSEASIKYTDDLLEAKAATATSVAELIARLYQPEQHLEWSGSSIVPGGECLEFSSVMKLLILRGAEALPALEKLIDDPAIQNEIILILGAVGNERTIPLLIDRFPGDEVVYGEGKFAENPILVRRVCFTFALTYLTGTPIGRSRWGTDFGGGMQIQWRDWWAKSKGDFRVSARKPNHTWVPGYPQLTEEWAAFVRQEFIGKR